jgi:ribulose-phosphate 3-epimerase
MNQWNDFPNDRLLAEISLWSANFITVHAENGHLAPVALQKIRQCGAGAGLALGLDVAPESVLPYLEMVDIVLIMGTPMGVKGGEPSKNAHSRIRAMRTLIDQAGLKEQVKLIADGRIRSNIPFPSCVEPERMGW